MKPPQPFPTLIEARKIKAPNLKDGEWPCVHCFGAGCWRCRMAGTGPRSAFVRWYLQKLKAYNDLVERYRGDMDQIMKVWL
jgi:hypothetical protein